MRKVRHSLVLPLVQTSSITRAPLPWTNYFPRPHVEIPPSWELEFKSRNFDRNTNLQSKVNSSYFVNITARGDQICNFSFSRIFTLSPSRHISFSEIRPSSVKLNVVETGSKILQAAAVNSEENGQLYIHISCYKNILIHVYFETILVLYYI